MVRGVPAWSRVLELAGLGVAGSWSFELKSGARLGKSAVAPPVGLDVGGLVVAPSAHDAEWRQIGSRRVGDVPVAPVHQVRHRIVGMSGVRTGGLDLVTQEQVDGDDIAAPGHPR